MRNRQLFKQILVPIDGSRASLIAEELTVFIAKKFTSQVTVLHVVSHELMVYPERHLHVPIGGFAQERHVPASSTSSVPERVVNEITNWYHQKGTQVVADAVALFNEERISVNHKIVEHADPANTILQEAEKGNYDLIIMGSSEEAETPHLGSVAKKVARHTLTPVLISREKRKVSKILVPLDGSENAQKALRHAVLLAEKTGAKITLLYVQESSLFKLRPEITKELGTRHLADATKQFKEINLDHQISSGDPAKIIVQTATNGDYDLIVMGSRGLSAIGRFLLGSVSDHVIHYSDCAVLLVK